MDNKRNHISYTYFVPAFLWALLILVVCLVPPKYIPAVEFNLLSPDKIAHAILFGFLCLLLNWALNKNNILNYKNLFVLFACTVGYGALIELLQMIGRSGRMAEVDDILANSFGAVMIYLIYIVYYRSLSRKAA
ncbi:MAG TPA: VanZ family protein [Flavobacteriales bacterium]|nr:VanZ family protein [Flavobacteriales bacterium]